MTKAKETRKPAKANPITVGGRSLEELELSDADKAILGEINDNRKAILTLGRIALDHERRLRELEEIFEDEEEPVELEAEPEEV